MKNKSSQWLGILPAAVVALCVVSSLSGYTKPVYDTKDTSSYKQTDDSSQTDDENSQTDNSSDTTDKSSNIEPVTNTKKPVKITAVADEDMKYKDGTYIGTGTGFDGEIKVQVTIKNGAIYDIKILSTNDGTEFINKASALISAIVKNQTTNVDAVSGATYSSNGIIEAVRNALSKAGGKESVSDSSTSTQQPTTSNSNNTNDRKPKKVKKVTENAKYKDGKYIGTGTGFGGEIKVQVTINKGKITGIRILKNSDGPEYIKKAEKLIKEIVKKQSTNVDAVSGATFSSNGIITAVRDALSKAEIKSNNSSDTSKPANNKPQTNTEIKGKFPYNDGVYIGTGEGYKGDVTVAVSIKNKTIDVILVLDSSDDANFFNRAKTLIDNVIKKQTIKVDAVSGATYSSEGIIEAIKNALKKAAQITNGHSPKDDSSSADTNSKNDSSSLPESNTDTDSSSAEGKIYKNGTYSAVAICVPDDDEDFEPYTLTVTVTIREDKIISITDIKGSGDDYDSGNDWYIKRAASGTSKYKGIVSQYTSKNDYTKIDAVSGATCSSQAIINAVNSALKNAELN